MFHTGTLNKLYLQTKIRWQEASCFDRFLENYHNIPSTWHAITMVSKTIFLKWNAKWLCMWFNVSPTFKANWKGLQYRNLHRSTFQSNLPQAKRFTVVLHILSTLHYCRASHFINAQDTKLMIQSSFVENKITLKHAETKDNKINKNNNKLIKKKTKKYFSRSSIVYQASWVLLTTIYTWHGTSSNLQSDFDGPLVYNYKVHNMQSDGQSTPYILCVKYILLGKINLGIHCVLGLVFLWI